MKSIQLTEEHKSKLLEMCKELFPEMDAYIVNDTKESNGFILGTWGQSTDGITIHWFEFCMTHLIDALAWENITSDMLADCQYENARLKYLLELAKDRPDPGQYHPIDYLYEEFKKLKL